MIWLIIIGIAVIWMIEQEMMAHAEHMDRMEEKEFNQNTTVNNTYTGDVDNVNDRYNFPGEKIVDIEVVEK